MAVTVDLVLGVEVDQLGQFVIAQDRLRQNDLVTGLRHRIEQIALRPHRGLQARHDLLADGVQRRVGHLGKELLEIVVKHPGPSGQDSDGGVGTHRADRLCAGARHRGDEKVEFLVAVAERQLAQDHPVVGHPDVGALRQVIEVELLGGEPLPIGVLGGEFGFDLLVGDDPALRGVDQEHAAGLQSHSFDDPRGVEIEDAGLGGHHHQTVVGHPDARRSQPVAVEDRTDDGAVAEAHRGGAVPGLHQGGVIRIERPPGRIHRRVSFPGLGDHHQHRVGQAAAAKVQEFENLIEAGAVGGTRSAHREDLRHVRAEDVGVDQRFTGAHPVLVAGDRVDLTVVGDPAERMCQRPGREGVGGEARVHDAQCALHPLVLQIEVEGL